MVIHPQESTFTVEAHLQAKKNQILFQTSDPETGVLVTPFSIIDLETEEKYNLQDTHLPYTKKEFYLTFLEYASQKVSVEIEPCDTAFIVTVPMLKLKPLLMTTTHSQVILDEISYPYEFFSNGVEIEKHLISQKPEENTILHTVMLMPTTKKITIKMGYFVHEVVLDATQIPCFVIDSTTILL